MGVVSLCDLLDDPGRLHFDSVDDVFVDLWFREPAPLPCKFPSVCQHLVAESTFVFRLVCVLWLAVLMEVASGHSTAFPVGHRVYRGCPCRDPPGVPQSPVRLFGKAPTLLGVVVGVLGVVTSGVHCARVPRVSRDVTTTVCGSCATEITHNPARLEALVKLSVVTILSHSYHFHQIFCGFVGALSPNRHLVRDLIGLFLLVVGSVAIHLVYANANLFLSRNIDQFRMLSRLSLDITAIFATGYTLYFVSAVL